MNKIFVIVPSNLDNLDLVKLSLKSNYGITEPLTTNDLADSFITANKANISSTIVIYENPSITPLSSLVTFPNMDVLEYLLKKLDTKLNVQFSNKLDEKLSALVSTILDKLPKSSVKNTVTEDQKLSMKENSKKLIEQLTKQSLNNKILPKSKREDKLSKIVMPNNISMLSNLLTLKYSTTKPDIKAMIAKEPLSNLTVENSVKPKTAVKEKLEKKIKQLVAKHDLNSLPLTQYMKVPMDEYKTVKKNTTIQSDYKNLLLVDTSVEQSQLFIDNSNNSTYPLGFNKQTFTQELTQSIDNIFKSIDRIAIVADAENINNKFFINSKPYFSSRDLEEDTNDLTKFSSNVQLIVNLVKKYNVKNLNFLMCNSLLNANWLSYYTLLNKLCPGLIIGASNNLTGNIKYGGDWVMESIGQDIQNTFFTDGISNYSENLGSTNKYIQFTNGNISVDPSSVFKYDVPSSNFTYTKNANVVNIVLISNVTILNKQDGFKFGSNDDEYSYIIDGAGYTVTVDDITNFPGLFVFDETGNNVTIKNLNIIAKNDSELKSYGGWLVYGNNSYENLNLTCTNCTVSLENLPISNDYVGGIMGGNNVNEGLLNNFNVLIDRCTVNFDGQNSYMDYAGSGGIMGGHNCSDGIYDELNNTLNISIIKSTVNFTNGASLSNDAVAVGGIMGGYNSQFIDFNFILNINECNVNLENGNIYGNACGGILGGYNVNNFNDSNNNISLSYNISDCTFTIDSSLLSDGYDNIGGIMGGKNCSDKTSSSSSSFSMNIGISGCLLNIKNGQIGNNDTATGGILGGRNVTFLGGLSAGIIVSIYDSNVTVDGGLPVFNNSNSSGGIIGGYNLYNENYNNVSNGMIISTNNCTITNYKCLMFECDSTGGIIGGYNIKELDGGNSDHGFVSAINACSINSYGTVMDSCNNCGGIFGGNNTHIEDSSISIVSLPIVSECVINCYSELLATDGDDSYNNGGIMGGNNFIFNNNGAIFINDSESPFPTGIIILKCKVILSAKESNLLACNNYDSNNDGGILGGNNLNEINNNAIDEELSILINVSGSYIDVSSDVSTQPKTLINANESDIVNFGGICGGSNFVNIKYNTDNFSLQFNVVDCNINAPNTALMFDTDENSSNVGGIMGGNNNYNNNKPGNNIIGYGNNLMNNPSGLNNMYLEIGNCKVNTSQTANNRIGDYFGGILGGYNNNYNIFGTFSLKIYNCETLLGKFASDNDNAGGILGGYNCNYNKYKHLYYVFKTEDTSPPDNGYYYDYITQFFGSTYTYIKLFNCFAKTNSNFINNNTSNIGGIMGGEFATFNGRDTNMHIKIMNSVSLSEISSNASSSAGISGGEFEYNNISNADTSYSIANVNIGTVDDPANNYDKGPYYNSDPTNSNANISTNLSHCVAFMPNSRPNSNGNAGFVGDSNSSDILNLSVSNCLLVAKSGSTEVSDGSGTNTRTVATLAELSTYEETIYDYLYNTITEMEGNTMDMNFDTTDVIFTQEQKDKNVVWLNSSSNNVGLVLLSTNLSKYSANFTYNIYSTYYDYWLTYTTINDINSNPTLEEIIYYQLLILMLNTTTVSDVTSIIQHLNFSNNNSLQNSSVRTSFNRALVAVFNAKHPKLSIVQPSIEATNNITEI